MIYLDNSATTFPKPPAVYRAVDRALRGFGFNPGRGGYQQSLETSKQIYETRALLKDFFHASSEENVIFTSGCTQAINTVIKGVLRRGDHAVISSLEHNAVVRPLQKLHNAGYCSYTVAQVSSDDDETIESFRRAINRNTRLFICTHASNVFGIRLPAERLCALAHSYGILFCLDAAQSAGLLNVDMEKDGYDFVCCAGHKYLYGPMGTGVLLLNGENMPDSLIEGGTGSESADANMPSYYPDRLEAGTQNIPGILGLKAGVRFVKDIGTHKIYQKEMRLLRSLSLRLNDIAGVKVYGGFSENSRSSPVLSFTVDGLDSEGVARLLSDHGIAVRSGLHCAPLAHRSMGTIDSGTVRVSPSYFTTETDMNLLVNSLRKLP